MATDAREEERSVEGDEREERQREERRDEGERRG